MDPLVVILDALDSAEVRRAPHVAAVAQIVLEALQAAGLVLSEP